MISKLNVMKKLTLYITTCLCLFLALSCKKALQPENITSLTIINALPGNRLMLADFSDKPANQFNSEGLILYYGLFEPNSRLSVQTKEQKLNFYKYPFVKGDQSLYQLTLNPKQGDINTLFITGTQSQPEHFVVNMKPPYYTVQDSLVGLRFVNLSAGSAPVQVKVSGQGLATAITTNNLAYKDITNYLPIPANSKIGNLLVEFIDQASGQLLASYPLDAVGGTITDNPWRFRNYTFALKGLPGATNVADAVDVFKINDY